MKCISVSFFVAATFLIKKSRRIGRVTSIRVNIVAIIFGFEKCEPHVDRIGCRDEPADRYIIVVIVGIIGRCKLSSGGRQERTTFNGQMN